MRKRGRLRPDPLALDLAPLKLDIEPLKLPDITLDIPAIEPLELPELPALDIKPLALDELPELPAIELEPIELDLGPVDLAFPELDLKLGPLAVKREQAKGPGKARKRGSRRPPAR